MSRVAIALAALLAAASSAAAGKVGYFESNDCADPKGFESCYEDADEAWADCVKDNCEDQNIDCINVCSCVRNLEQLDCAGRSCWNQVYSCQYQETVGELTSNCLNPKYDRIPFWPPPDNAPAGCSCNFGKIIKSQVRTTEELENTCGVSLLENENPTNDVIQEVAGACQCCASSAYLSAIWDICPSTDPALLGANEWFAAIASLDKNWPMCGEFMEAYPCDDTLGMSPPADNTTNFYAQGEFPSNGTQTLFNTGTISSPVSGATYTYSYFDGLERVVTVASADARPTQSGGDSSSNDDNDDDDSNNRTSEDSNESNGGTTNDNDGSGATSLNPWLMFAFWPLAGMAMVVVWL